MCGGSEGRRGQSVEECLSLISCGGIRKRVSLEGGKKRMGVECGVYLP